MGWIALFFLVLTIASLVTCGKISNNATSDTDKLQRSVNRLETQLSDARRNECKCP
jgi:hypothetical protein